MDNYVIENEISFGNDGNEDLHIKFNTNLDREGPYAESWGIRK